MATQFSSKIRQALLTTVALLSIGLPLGSLLSSSAAMAKSAPNQNRPRHDHTLKVDQDDLVAKQSMSTSNRMTSYRFTIANFAGDTFTQLLGINNEGTISGYHGQAINKGFTLTLPSNFIDENFTNSAQTQVVGINNRNETGGFYVDAAGTTHGFVAIKGKFSTVDASNTAFNQVLGLNDNGVAAGYSSTDPTGATKQLPYVVNHGKFTYLTSLLPQGTGNAQATDINNDNHVSGFYVDANGVNHGFVVGLEHQPKLTTIDYPGATSTQVLGLNNRGQLSGVYMDAQNQTHGFVVTNGKFQSIDAPQGVGTTTINGINDKGQVVGFFGPQTNTQGFEAAPSSNSHQ